MDQRTTDLAADLAAIGAEILSATDAARPITPFSARGSELSVADAYRVSYWLEQARRARGETAVGRKIGFTNRNIWAEYNVYAPNWGYVTTRSVRELADTPVLSLACYAAPRIEPEIMFGLRRAPAPDMDEAALLDCVDWVAHGYEIVQSIFPNWIFTATDTTAANALHGALLVGPRRQPKGDAATLLRQLAGVEIALSHDGQLVDRGRGDNVLGSPVAALKHLVALLNDDPLNPPLDAGEIVSTGTVTRAFPIAAGETWTTELTGSPLPGARIAFA